MTLLEQARAGDWSDLIARLEYASRRNAHRGGRASVGEQLIDEALYYARRGDFDEATHRLRLRTEPKFGSVFDCQVQYEIAMAAKRKAAQS